MTEPQRSRLARFLPDLAEMARERIARPWAAHLVTKADGDEWERAVALDALVAMRWGADDG